MKTTLDVVDAIFNALKGSTLENVISGSIYKHRRVLNSKKEDVVINSLPINNEQLQQCVANVNIHVPDVTFKVDGNVEYQPDHTRLLELAAEAVQSLEAWESDYHFDVQQQSIIQEESAKEHFINIRLNFYSINL